MSKASHNNRQDNSGRKGFMKFLQNLALLVHLLMIVYISRRKRQNCSYHTSLCQWYGSSCSRKYSYYIFQDGASQWFWYHWPWRAKIHVGNPCKKTYNCTNQLIFLSQSTYIHQVLTQFGMQNTTPVFTPLGVKHNLSISQSPMSEAEKQAYKEYLGNI